jgi:multidrug efflux system membrane fusion protein
MVFGPFREPGHPRFLLAGHRFGDRCQRCVADDYVKECRMRFAPCLALAASLGLLACSPPPPAPEPVQSVRTVLVSTEAVNPSFEYAAEIRARTESRLSFRVGGKVVRRQVELGDTVKAGQVLAQLDPQDFRLGQDAAQAAREAARVNLMQAQADLKRYQELRDQGFISSAELERRDTAYKAAKAQFDQAQAQNGVQGNQAAYATLVSDVDGVVTGVDVEPGTVVAAGAPVLRLAQNGPRDAVFAVPEDKVALVKALETEALKNPNGASAFQVRLWGDQDVLLPARIREVSAAADPATRTFQIKVDLGPSSSTLRQGQTATVLMRMPAQAGVTKLPITALKAHQGKSAVWVVQEPAMTLQLQPVEIGGADGNEAVVLGGLKAGQRVVTAGVHVLTEGQKIKLYEPPTAAAAHAAAPVLTAASAP